MMKVGKIDKVFQLGKYAEGDVVVVDCIFTNTTTVLIVMRLNQEQ